MIRVSVPVGAVKGRTRSEQETREIENENKKEGGASDCAYANERVNTLDAVRPETYLEFGKHVPPRASRSSTWICAWWKNISQEHS